MKDYKRLTKRYGNIVSYAEPLQSDSIGIIYEEQKKREMMKRLAELEDKIESGELCDRKETARDIVEMLKVAKGVVKVHFEAYDELIENIVEKYGLGDEDENVLDNCVYKHPYPQEGIGDVMEWRESRGFAQAFSDCGNDLAEMEHLAEVAEKALQYAVSEYRCDECPCLDCNAEIRGSQECIDLIIKTYKESAEVELKKEKDND